jgi:hypothetical protein
MGHRTIESVLVHDNLGGCSPYYEGGDEDIWYLGLAGEQASEVRCCRICLPMLSQEQFDWKAKLEQAIIEAASLRPLYHVENFQEAVWDFSTRFNCEDFKPEDLGIWIGDEKTVKALKSKVEYQSNGHYKPGLHYDVDRKNIEIKELPFQPKTIILLPNCEHFGILAKNDKFFNFMFRSSMIFRYHLKTLEIEDGHNTAFEG